MSDQMQEMCRYRHDPLIELHSESSDVRTRFRILPGAGQWFGARWAELRSPNARILAYDHLENHAAKGINVLFGDLHVDFADAPSAQRLIARLNAGHNPPDVNWDKPTTAPK